MVNMVKRCLFNLDNQADKTDREDELFITPYSDSHIQGERHPVCAS